MTSFTDLLSEISRLDDDARQLLARAAAAGHFDDVAQLTPIVKEIAEMAHRWSSEEEMARVPGSGNGDACERQITTTATANGSTQGVRSTRRAVSPVRPRAR